MDQRTIRRMTVLLPGLESGDLDSLDGLPGDGIRVTGRIISGTAWTRATVSCVTIARSYFTASDLSSARFEGVNWDRCLIRGSTLIGAHLSNGTLKNVIFENCLLDYATLDQMRVTGPVAFVGCSLIETTISRCQFTGVLFDGCNLRDTRLDGSNLRDADIRGNDLSGLIGIAALRHVTISHNQLPGLTETVVRDLSLNVVSTSRA